jgi:hypothetical protein
MRRRVSPNLPAKKSAIALHFIPSRPVGRRRGIVIKHLHIVDGKIHVHAGSTGISTTKAFTHGRIAFDIRTRLATFGSNLPPVAIPSGFRAFDGAVLSLQLVGPDGTLRPQTRSGVLRQVFDKKGSPIGLFRIPGQSKTPARNKPEDGWTVEVFKFRAYFTHPGVNLSGEIPEWLEVSIKRQRNYWNQLSWLCREARRACSPVPTAEIIGFVQKTILPKLDEFNNWLVRSNQKIKHPNNLKVAEPGIDALWSFAGQLRRRIDKNQQVPVGLLEEVIAFGERYKPDYTPYNAFESSLDLTMKAEAANMGLRPYEKRALDARLKNVLANRKTRKLSWSDGWPNIKFHDSPDAKDWNLQYYFNQPDVKASGLEDGSGANGLDFEAPLPPQATGHPQLHGIAAKNKLRVATINVPSGERGKSFKFKFVVLQHRDFPENSNIKQWELSFVDGKLWLLLTVERQYAVTVSSPIGAGLDIGWRRIDEGIRIGVLYNPATKGFREIVIDLQKSPGDQKNRKADFRVNLGPTRWERRNVQRIIPDWKEGDTLPGTLELRRVLSARRSELKDHAKVHLREHLGDNVPSWFEKAGRKGLRQLADEMKDDNTVQGIVSSLITETDALNDLARYYLERSTARLEYGYHQVAYDVCHYLKESGVTYLVVESNFLAKVAQEGGRVQEESNDAYALKNSRKYRHFAGVKKFVSILRQTAGKCGIVVSDISSENTTRICQHCDHPNPATAKESFQCEKCERLIHQDQNAAINLSRFANQSDLVQGTEKKRVRSVT